MGAQVGFSGRTGQRALLALVAVVSVWMVVGATQANATLTVIPQAQGAGTITNGSGSFYGYSCNQNGNLDDRVVQNCPLFQVGSFCPFGCFDVPFVLVATPSATPSGHWSFAGWLGCPSPSGNTCTMINPGFNSFFYVPRAVFNDSVGPTLSSIQVEKSTSTDRGVRFINVGTNEDLSALDCSVDGGPFTPCTTVRQVPEGTRQVRARGTDRSGNVGAVSGVLASFRIIDTTLTNTPPAAFSNVKRPTFNYDSVAGLTFECRLFNTVGPVPAFAPCGSKVAPITPRTFTPAADLTDGSKTFQVRAKDGPDQDEVPFTHVWTVDTVAPNVINLGSPTITEGIVTTALSAAFTFATSEAPASFARFECKIDTGNFETCASGKTFSDLPFGERTFSVRGVDKAGNVGPTVSRSWTVAARDNDGDGFNQRSDCDDANPAINPIATDIPDNGVDENCDGVQATDPDRDDDGFQPPADCNDSNPNIKPGVADTPDNGVDENCDGSDAKTPPLPRVPATVSFNFPAPGAKFTKFTVFLVKTVPAGSKIVATCKGKACGKKPPKQTIRNARGTVRLKKFQKKFKVGSVIEVRVTKSGMEGIVKQVKINKRKNPSIITKCLAGSRVVRCG